MSKLYWRYGCVRAGKTTELLRIRDNYVRQNKEVQVWKPSMDTRDGRDVVSRLGLTYEADYLIDPQAEWFGKIAGKPVCILIDEAQFMTTANVEGIRKIPEKFKIPVICYGLRAHYNGVLFEGAAALFACADSIAEIKTICWHPDCTRKAVYNAIATEKDEIAPPPSRKDKSIRKAAGVAPPVILGHGFLPTCPAHWNG